MVLEDKEPIYLLCNKPAPLAKASLIIKIKKPQLLQNSKKKRIQKGTVIKLIFIILVKNKEHMSSYELIALTSHILRHRHRDDK